MAGEKLILKDARGRFLPGCNPNPTGITRSKRQYAWDKVFDEETRLTILNRLRDKVLLEDSESAMDFVASRLAVAKPKTDLEEQKLELEIEILRKGALEFDARLKETQRSVDALHKLIGVIKDDDRYKPVVEQVLSTLVGGQHEEESNEDNREE